MSDTERPTDSSDAPPAVTDREALVEVRELRTYYEEGGLLGGTPVKAVDGVSFDIHRGETLGLVGESGCGKTTLGRTLIRLESATAGEVRFDGTDITTLSGGDLKEWRSNAQMVFQDPESSLNERMTVGEIVQDPLDVHGWRTPAERRGRVQRLLERVGLTQEHYFRYPHQFSGGQRQRVGIARALALQPDFVVLDEPVSALDVSVQAKILNLLQDLQDEMGLTYLLIAHDLSVVRHLADRVAVMYLGNVMELGETEALFTDPANPYTRSLLSAIPEPDPSADSDRITLRGAPPSPRDPPQGCPFTTRCPSKIRPEEYPGVEEATWVAVEELREILRERARADRSLLEAAREVLGMETRLSDVGEVRTELFDGVPQPEAVAVHVDEAVRRVRDGDPESARVYLREELGSVCDHEHPEYHEVDAAGRRSLCHRHAQGHEDPRSIDGDGGR